MNQDDLDKKFNEAVEIACKMTQASLPQDTQLRLYAFYKQASFGSTRYSHSENFDLRNAFKTNAWMQISHISINEAKEEYIKIINSITKSKIL